MYDIESRWGARLEGSHCGENQLAPRCDRSLSLSDIPIALHLQYHLSIFLVRPLHIYQLKGQQQGDTLSACGSDCALLLDSSRKGCHPSCPQLRHLEQLHVWQFRRLASTSATGIALGLESLRNAADVVVALGPWIRNGCQWSQLKPRRWQSS